MGNTRASFRGQRRPDLAIAQQRHVIWPLVLVSAKRVGWWRRPALTRLGPSFTIALRTIKMPFFYRIVIDLLGIAVLYPNQGGCRDHDLTPWPQPQPNGGECIPEHDDHLDQELDHGDHHVDHELHRDDDGVDDVLNQGNDGLDQADNGVGNRLCRKAKTLPYPYEHVDDGLQPCIAKGRQGGKRWRRCVWWRRRRGWGRGRRRFRWR